MKEYVKDQLTLARLLESTVLYSSHPVAMLRNDSFHEKGVTGRYYGL